MLAHPAHDLVVDSTYNQMEPRQRGHQHGNPPCGLPLQERGQGEERPQKRERGDVHDGRTDKPVHGPLDKTSARRRLGKVQLHKLQEPYPEGNQDKQDRLAKKEVLHQGNKFHGDLGTPLQR